MLDPPGAASRPHHPDPMSAPMLHPSCLSRRGFSENRRLGHGRADPAAVAAGRGVGGHPLVAEVGHPHLPGRRAAAPGHVRPEARRPEEIAGPWKPIADQRHRHPDLRGAPRLAAIMDKLAIVRSLVGNQADHDAIQVFNGLTPASRRPAAAGRSSAPPSPSCRAPPIRRCRRSSASATPARTARTTSRAPGSSGRRSPRSGRSTRPQTCASAALGRSPRRPQDAPRRLRRLPPLVDATGADAGRWTRSTSRRSDCSHRRRSRRARPVEGGPEDRRPLRHRRPEDVHGRQRRPRVPQSLLMARRLIEAGARVVTLNYSKWDWHGGNAEGRANNSIFCAKRRLPGLRPVRQRPGRGPAPARPGRGLHGDHHGRVRPHAEDQRRSAATTGRRSTAPAGRRRDEDRPGHRRDRPDRRRGRHPAGHVRRAFATLYNNLGIDVARPLLSDIEGRPHFLVDDHAQPIEELA